jgi:hypothetical protein
LATILYFEPIPEKLSAITSGATPIRSAERAPDKNKKARKNSTRREEERGDYDRTQVSLHSLGGYLCQENCRMPDGNRLTRRKIQNVQSSTFH